MRGASQFTHAATFLNNTPLLPAQGLSAGDPFYPILDGLWLRVDGESGDVEGRNSVGSLGYDYLSGGVTAGLDLVFSDHLIGGIMAGYTRTDIDYEGNSGGAQSNGGSFGVYGSLFDQDTNLDGILMVGANDYDLERNIIFTGVNETARSDFTGFTFTAALEARERIQIPTSQTDLPLIVTPKIGIDYSGLYTEAFQESGAPGYNLDVGDDYSHGLGFEYGADISTFYDVIHTNKAYVVNPTLSLGLRTDVPLDDRTITSSFLGVPGTFKSTGDDKAQFSVNPGFSLAVFDKNQNALALNYGYAHSPGKTQTHRIGVKLDIKW